MPYEAGQFRAEGVVVFLLFWLGFLGKRGRAVVRVRVGELSRFAFQVWRGR